MNLDLLLARFETEYQQTNSITVPRRAQQMTTLRRFAASLDHPLDELTPSDVQAFMAAEIERGQRPNTVRKTHGMIRSFQTWMASAGIIDTVRHDQLKLVRNPRGSAARSKPNPYTAADIARLRATLAQRYPTLPIAGSGSRALRRFIAGRTEALRTHLWRHVVRTQLEAQIALALELGLRRIEVYSLTIDALHPDNDAVVVLTAKQEPGSRVRRAVPYTSHAHACVSEWLDLRDLLIPGHDEPWLYLRYYGTRDVQLQPMPFWKMKDSLRKQLGEEWRWHRLRHTAATEWLRAGMALEKVSVMMGHSSLEQTREYTQILRGDVRHSMSAAAEAFAQRMGVPA